MQETPILQKAKQKFLQLWNDARIKLNNLKQKYLSQFPDLITSYGDTPSCSLADNFEGFDEIRPGNFVYYDVMQYHIGSCSLDEIAVAVACPVVAIHPERNEVVIYGGAVHFSKEFICCRQRVSTCLVMSSNLKKTAGVNQFPALMFLHFRRSMVL